MAHMKLRTRSQITYYAFTEIWFSLPVKINEIPSANVLWDGAFALARTFNPTNEDTETNKTFVSMAIQSSAILGCPITPKVHTTHDAEACRMANDKYSLGAG